MAQALWTQAATAIMNALNATGAPATFYRARFEAVGQAETAGSLFPTKIDCRYDDTAHDSAKIDATFVVRVDVAAFDEVDLIADPLIVWAWRQIRKDHTLGIWNNGIQLASDVYIDNIELGYVDKSASDQVCVDMTIRVEVEVDRDDPTISMTHI